MEEIDCIFNAVNGTTKYFLSESQLLQGGMKQIETQLKNEPYSNSDRFNVVMNPFFQQSSSKVEKLAKDAQELNEKFKELAIFYGEDPMTDSDSFFNTIVRFCNNYRQAVSQEENIQKESLKKSSNLPVKKTMNQAKVELKGELDSLINKMRSGDY